MDRNWTRLHSAAGAGDLDAVDALLRGRANVHARAGVDDQAERAPLHCAVDRWQGRADDAARAAVVERLLAAGANVDAVDVRGMTPLHVAAQGSLVLCCARLLDAGAGIDAADRDPGWTALHMTASAAVAALLLDRGAAIDAPARAETPMSRGDRRFRIPLGATPADVATILGRDAVLALLLDRGATRTIGSAAEVEIVAVPTPEPDPFARDARGRSALHRSSDIQRVKALLAAGAAVDEPDLDGMTPLACLLSNSEAHYRLDEVVALLLDAGANPNINVPDRMRGKPQPVALALVRDWTQRRGERIGATLDLLLRRGADPNATDGKNWTALHEAVFRRHTQAIALLVRAGARSDLASTGRMHTFKAGVTAADVASARGVSLT
ncbi:MAG TPA: ankyrin repeat domain-containing protein [Kofleriaceae bacterium]